MGATVLDGLIIGIPVGIVFDGILGITGYGFGAIDDVFLVIYQIFLLGAPRAQTVGNMAVSTRVVDAATGTAIGTGKATIRAIVQLVLNISIIGGLLNVLWPLWDQQNQTLHDKAAGTLVVMAR
ncbi:MAG: RDD family protein [Acidimicrobiales bacterium]|nr:RDD family protein [Acidimicrobiales bacterium]